MSVEQLKTQLREYLADASPMIDIETVKDDDNLEDAGLDSLDMVNFLLSIEENLSVKIADEELPDLNTINEFVKRVQSAS